MAFSIGSYRNEFVITIFSIISVVVLLFSQSISDSEEILSAPRILETSQSIPKVRPKTQIVYNEQRNPDSLRQQEIEPQTFLDDFESTYLANLLFREFPNISESSLEGINRIIEISDTLIANEPDFYSAYKAKLLALIIKEIKFKQPVSLMEYEDVYNELLSFTGITPRDEVIAELRGAEELTGLDMDIIHIPFLRLKALGDYEGIVQMAEEYIEAYPRSYLGYWYLAQAAWNLGDSAYALNAMRRALGAEVRETAAYDILARVESTPALNRIYAMSLE